MTAQEAFAFSLDTLAGFLRSVFIDANIFAVVPTDPTTVTTTFTAAGNQNITSNQPTQVALQNGASSFCSCSGSTITITETGIYNLSAGYTCVSTQASGQTQYATIQINRNGGKLFGNSPSQYSYGTVGIDLSVGTSAALAAGDTLTLSVYTHASNNGDTGDYVSGATFTVVKEV